MFNNLKWPEDRIFPAFAEPASPMDAIHSDDMTPDEQTALGTLQGIVNRRQPRILIIESECDEGGETWPKTMGLTWKYTDFISIFKKYAGEADGAVIFDDSLSRHYLNLASTAAGVKNAVAMKKSVYEELKANGIVLDILEDISGLTMTKAKDIYTYMYDKYWADCTHRIIISQLLSENYKLRDLCTAVGCAMVFLENRKEEDRLVYEKFLADMEPGKAIALGWYTEERSGITTATAYGLSTVPADHYNNFTVYAQDKPVRVRPEREAPEPENKIYGAVFVSDGDNIQYNEHYMRKYWDASEADRGLVAINWTISPSLVDVAPDIMNYYYDHSTEKDCFVSGPSGLGYAMPVNTLPEEIEAKNYVRDDNKFGKYAALSNRYFERAGMRAVTIWDNLTDNQREVYTKNAPYLYGLTVQLFTDHRESISSEANGKLIKQLTPCYTTTVEHFTSCLTDAVKACGFDGSAPKFIACQFSVWGTITIKALAEIEKELNEMTGGNFEFVRADDFFRMYYKSKKDQ